jgi:hypothetical protein
MFLILFTAAAAFLLFPFGRAVSAAEFVGGSNAEQSISYKFLVDFVTQHSARTAGTKECDEAASYIVDFFQDRGVFADAENDLNHTLTDYTPYSFENKALVTDMGEMPFTFYAGETSTELKSKNIVYVKKAAKPNPENKQVIVGAHYDNGATLSTGGSSVEGGEGASDNGSGMAVFFSLAVALQGVELEFDVVFAAFSAEEYGLVGSRYFVSNMTKAEKEKTLLMVNLDVVSGGDYLYLYTDEVKRIHGDFLLAAAKKSGVVLKSVPNYRILPYSDGYSGLPYMTYGMMSDHAPFYREGINVASFMSANFEITSSFDLRESASHPNLVNQKEDTLENYIAYYGTTGYKKADGIVSLLCAAFIDTDFVSAMVKSAEARPSFALFDNIAFVISIYAAAALLLAGGAYLVYVRLKNLPERELDRDNTKKAEDIIVFEDFGI